jgi:hypothetical protein
LIGLINTINGSSITTNNHETSSTGNKNNQ